MCEGKDRSIRQSPLFFDFVWDHLAAADPRLTPILLTQEESSHTKTHPRLLPLHSSNHGRGITKRTSETVKEGRQGYKRKAGETPCYEALPAIGR